MPDNDGWETDQINKFLLMQPVTYSGPLMNMEAAVAVEAMVNSVYPCVNCADEHVECLMETNSLTIHQLRPIQKRIPFASWVP